MRNKGIEQIPMHYVVMFVIFSFVGAVFYLLLVRWLDLTGFKYELITQRNAIDLIQLIVTSSPIVKRDSNNEPIKLVLDKAQLDDYQSSFFNLHA